jgi:hypothetical protein
MLSKIGFAALIVAVFMFGAATEPSASAAPNDDACLLVTQSQLSADMGVSMAAGTHVTPEYVKTCTWAPTGGPTKDLKYVTVSFEDAGAYQSGKMLMQQMQTMMKMKKDEEAGQLANASAGGIGDDAYYTSMGGGYTGLIVKKGNVAFKIAIYGNLPMEKKKALEKTLALQVISKL